MAGISDKAIKTNYAENKYKYNGIEYDSTFGLDEYEAHFRDLDPQTGRWWQIDPQTEGYENISTYASMYDDPTAKSDPLGDEADGCCKALWQGIKDLGSGVYNAAVTDARLFNEYVNPITPVGEFITGKSIESDLTDDKPRIQSATEMAMVLIGGKVEESGAKLLEKGIVKLEEKAAANTTEKTVVKKVAEDLPKPPKGKGTAPPSERDPKRLFTKEETATMLKKQDNNCAQCGQPKQAGDVHGHHKIRHADGGRTTINNGAAVCKSCHIKIHQ